MDAYHVIGNDLQLGASGDLAVVSDTQETNQRIVRTLLTAVGSYFWNPTFGTVVPSTVGEPLSQELLRRIEAEVKASLLGDDDVASDPAPEIKVETTNNGLVYTIRYFNINSEEQDTISFKVT